MSEQRASLKSFRIPRKDVLTSGGTFAVRGASAADVTAVFLEHGAEAQELYRRLMKGDEIENQEDAVLQAIAVAPKAFASLVAHCLDEPEEWETVLMMSLADQMALVEGIVSLTFPEGGPKNVSGVVAALRPVLDQVETTRH